MPMGKKSISCAQVRWICSKNLSRDIERPHWPTELSGQLLRHIDQKAKYFVSLDLTSVYHKIKIDDKSSNLLVISTLKGRFKFTVLAQGICSSLDIFNYLTDGSMLAMLALKTWTTSCYTVGPLKNQKIN